MIDKKSNDDWVQEAVKTTVKETMEMAASMAERFSEMGNVQNLTGPKALKLFAEILREAK